MKVCEIFTSIQGESSYAGIPCIFVRLTGCNLRCSYCDTKYAYYEGIDLSEEDILNEVKITGIRLVEITGGEPLLQKSVLALVRELLEERYKVLIETNGSQNIKGIDKRAVVILDIKTPGSGESGKMDFSNIELIKKRDEIKFVITDRNDYLWAKGIIEKYGLLKRCNLLLSPAHGILHPSELAKWMIEDRCQARLNLQIHKYIYEDEKRGL